MKREGAKTSSISQGLSGNTSLVECEGTTHYKSETCQFCCNKKKDNLKMNLDFTLSLTIEHFVDK